MLSDNKKSPRNLTYSRVYNYALEMFGYDKDRTIAWWMSKIKELDDKSPFEMVKMGKGRKLMKYIIRCR